MGLLFRGRYGIMKSRSYHLDYLNGFDYKSFSFIRRLKEDCCITFPQTALREMTSCLFSYAVVPECDRYDYLWEKGFWDVENRGRINENAN